jgi:nucleotide-binding universal stress UspA family protein
MYKKILVAVDGSPTSTRGLDEAIKLAKLTGARLKLVHVIDQVSLMTAMGSYAVFSAETIEMLRQGAQEILAKAKARAGKAIGKVDTQLIDSMAAGVADSVVGAARSWHTDLIVLGTHGRRGVKRLVMGSDAEQITRLADVPVLLVRAARGKTKSA